MEELSYSLHLSNDKNKSKKARRSIKNTETGTTSLSNNAIQNHQQLSKVDKHNLRKYDEEENRKMQEKKKEKEQWVYENLIQWLRTHEGKMPSTYFFKDGQWLHWNDQLTEDNLFEKKLYNSWVRSDLRKLMIKYDGVKIDDIPEEYRDKISMLREYGVKVNQNKSKKASKVNEEER